MWTIGRSDLGAGEPESEHGAAERLREGNGRDRRRRLLIGWTSPAFEEIRMNQQALANPRGVQPRRPTPVRRI